ncbi:hypothetical protein EKO04_009294 [Ascochyta lentis]|uniref:Uncharacterized protein n=1 Tax=Ascochyta lentis TaxID=205686 RepID=A0A8H7MFF3_9PLEO|nr:hypothetical protein EKO04_009294 [Ascochyta lentis]
MPFQRNAINSDKVSKHEAKSSHVIRAGGLLHVTGWMGDVPETGKIIEGGIEAQADQTFKNIAACLEAAGSSMDKVVNRRLYVINIKDLPAIQKVTTRYFEEPYPCSTAVQISGLAKPGALLEIEVVAEA